MTIATAGAFLWAKALARSGAAEASDSDGRSAVPPEEIMPLSRTTGMTV